MVDPDPQHDPLQGRKEYAPVRYDLANDPDHTQLRAVNAQDLERFDYLLDGTNYDELGELIELWRQALRWQWSNLVSDPDERLCASDADGTPGTGYTLTFACFGRCFVCHPHQYPPHLWNKMVRSGTFTTLDQHCAAHAEEYHQWVPTRWHCCAPPYDPANAYRWREHDPWLLRRED